ncbi:Uncharacterized protein BP5553_01601 [Venustampulla echinocandica]|uniref:Amidohydrolase-related domain-containing protein n=1 Tax=Venustampulla echinocandica TaxID=2656787 RepID=A0A370U1G3_9HELO|nr:Uncharacterized protein BP5553_01601 [Venustampulla echinocandica]RDL41622.1 Uncharacterized protein BP5553_01601 [Venustampulla echinocandica]
MSYTIHTSTLFDPKKKKFVSEVSITVEPITGTIIKVYERTEKLEEVPEGDVDLREKVVMPGFVEAHSHIFLHDYDERASVNQKRDESVVERIIRASNHCRTALLAGYTTYRDLGSESMGNSDASMRDAINRGLMPGPRLFVATKALASTGSYEPRTESEHTCLPSGADCVDGAGGARLAVRRRIAAGADVIKYFADYRRRVMRFPPTQQHPYINDIAHLPEDPNPDVLVFAQEEVNMIIKEARLAKAPVACHAGTIEGAMMAVEAGVNTLEHCYFANAELFEAMVSKNVIFVPTLSVCEKLHSKRYPEIKAQTKLAYDLGVRFACGADIGPVSHGKSAREMELMIEAGIPLEDVLEACSVGGWESCGGDLCGVKFGWFEPGLRADIIALDKDPREDIHALRNVSFVMKDARIWKQDGKAVGMVQDSYTW